MKTIIVDEKAITGKHKLNLIQLELEHEGIITITSIELCIQAFIFRQHAITAFNVNIHCADWHCVP